MSKKKNAEMPRWAVRAALLLVAFGLLVAVWLNITYGADLATLIGYP